MMQNNANYVLNDVEKYQLNLHTHSPDHCPMKFEENLLLKEQALRCEKKLCRGGLRRPFIELARIHSIGTD